MNLKNIEIGKLCYPQKLVDFVHKRGLPPGEGFRDMRDTIASTQEDVDYNLRGAFGLLPETLSFEPEDPNFHAHGYGSTFGRPLRVVNIDGFVRHKDEPLRVHKFEPSGKGLAISFPKNGPKRVYLGEFYKGDFLNGVLVDTTDQWDVLSLHWPPPSFFHTHYKVPYLASGLSTSMTLTPGGPLYKCSAGNEPNFRLYVKAGKGFALLDPEEEPGYQETLWCLGEDDQWALTDNVPAWVAPMAPKS